MSSLNVSYAVPKNLLAMMKSMKNLSPTNSVPLEIFVGYNEIVSSFNTPEEVMEYSDMNKSFVLLVMTEDESDHFYKTFNDSIIKRSENNAGSIISMVLPVLILNRRIKRTDKSAIPRIREEAQELIDRLISYSDLESQVSHSV